LVHPAAVDLAAGDQTVHVVLQMRGDHCPSALMSFLAGRAGIGRMRNPGFGMATVPVEDWLAQGFKKNGGA